MKPETNETEKETKNLESTNLNSSSGVKQFTINQGQTTPLNLTIANRPIQGLLEITKIDAITKAPLQGATFNVLNSAGKVVGTGTTNTQGKLTINNLSAGKYTYVETAAPTGYFINNTPGAFNITTNGEVVSNSVSNQPMEGSLEITKIDAITKAPLQGATFNVLNSAGKVVGTGTTNTQGQLTINNLPLGNYTYVETVAPLGYILNSTAEPFTIKADGHAVVEEVTNEAMKGSLEITKIDSVTKAPLQGAAFNVLNSAGKVVGTGTANAQGQLTINNLPLGNYTYVETVAPLGYILNSIAEPFTIKADGHVVVEEVTNEAMKGSLEITKIDSVTKVPLQGATFNVLNSAGKVVGTGTTNTQGQLTINNLPLGNYTYVETVAPLGYILNSIAEPFTIKADGHVVVEEVTNEAIQGSLEITKIDAVMKAPLQGATFNILNSVGKVVGTGTTNVKGELIINNLPAGKYTYVETIAPTGYVLENTPVSFSITTNDQVAVGIVKNISIKGSLTIVKTDAVTKEPLQGATFNVLNSSGKVVATGTTNVQGRLTINNLPAGSYTYVEIIAPTGYVLDSTPVSFSIKTNGQVVTEDITNEVIQGSLEIIKIDAATKEPLQGATFNVLNSSGIVVATGTTNAQGGLIISDLLAGDYTYVETVAPTGYVLNNTPVSFSITTNKQVITANIVNQAIEGSLEITKIDAVTKVPLQGAKFNILNSSGTVVATGTTNEQGKLTINNLPLGKYTYIETIAPVGYELNNEPILFSITTNGKVVTESIPNQAMEGSLEIIKTDRITGAPLACAKFIIKNNQNNIVACGWTNSQGKLCFSLPYGSYTYQEVCAPNGYQTNTTPILFKINTSNKVVTANVTNQAITLPVNNNGILKITKVDLCNIGEVLPGAQFQIINSNGNIVQTVVTNNQGVAEVSLPAGIYYVIEIKAPIGYGICRTRRRITVMAGKTSELLSRNRKLNNCCQCNPCCYNPCNFPNSKMISPVNNNGILKITKVDLCNIGEVLPGAQFQIVDCNGNIVKTVVTNNQGIAEVSLPAGVYHVIETKAPVGYGVCKTRRRITVMAGKTSELLSRDIKINGCSYPY